MGKMYSNLYMLSGSLMGFISSVASIYLWYITTIRDEIIKGMPLIMIFFILLPACLALISSFINPPLILLAFVWGAPLSLYMLAYSNIGRWFGVTCILYLVSAILKFYGSKHKPII
ncbi:hypothetical protein EDM52_21595 [Brevibacillus invocatus]|uniref:Uncharacterized protein n=1 Tax=Brevibacillus invocatus TaxID=173959 RepID=A0A3M8BZ78_9BACL|nr:hypothetical protein EDM52_21595 [Brevibacillus invocatus]